MGLLGDLCSAHCCPGLACLLCYGAVLPSPEGFRFPRELILKGFILDEAGAVCVPSSSLLILLKREREKEKVKGW